MNDKTISEFGLVSVIMSTYKEPADYVFKAIKSIQNQSHKNLEIIIVIDDPTNEELKKMIIKLQEIDSRIKIIFNNKNIGLVQSLNKALSYCSGKLVARMDADDISDSHRIEKQLLFLQEHKYDMVSSNFKMFFDESDDIRTWKFPEKYQQCIKMLEYANCMPHPAWLVKKEVFKELNGYRDIFACEDYDFIIRAVLAGFKIGNCQEYLLKYRYNYNGISRSNTVKQQVISRYLGQEYKRGKSVTVDEYNNFISSKEYLKKTEELKKLYKLKQEIKVNASKSDKLKNCFKLAFNKSFWKEEYLNYQIKKLRN